MSGAFVANADDVTSSLWNPAGLAQLQENEVVYDLSQGAFSIGYTVPRLGTLGFSLLDLNGADRFFINDSNNPIGTFERGYNQALLSYATSLGQNVQLGASLGYTHVPNDGSAWQPNYDIGVIRRMSPYVTLGAQWRDIFGVELVDGRGRLVRRFDPRFDIGATWQPIQRLMFNSTLDTALWRLRTGIEADWYTIALRLGSGIELGALNQRPDWSLGFSFRFRRRQLHYAYMNQYDSEDRHLLSVGFMFGEVKPPRPIRPTEDTLQPQPILPSTTHAISTNEIASEYHLEVELILALVKAESAFQPDAISSSGAVGLTQLMPDTARSLGLRVPGYSGTHQPTVDATVDERFHPAKNLVGGVRYLDAMMKRYEGNHALALAAYHAGPESVNKDTPLVQKTERHVEKVLKHYYEYKGDEAAKMADLQKLDALLIQ